MRRLIPLAAIVTPLIVLALMAFGFGTAQPVAARNGSTVPVIDNNNRVQVAATYRSAVEQNLLLNPTWSGDTSGCEAGDANDTFDAATVESINWFRRMAGLNPVSESPRQSTGAQDAALMMHAQNSLSHYPANSWRCHTASGAESAGLSNLTLGIVGPRGVIGQIEDAGAGNQALGHRRWLLYPELQHVGIGNTSRASVVQVINDFGSRYSKSQWVSWPPAGFVPDRTVYDRWSLSYAGTSSIDFSSARVTVTENGRTLQVRLLPIANGYGDATLGWEVIGANPRAAGDVVYKVSVSGIVVGGRSVTHNYSVTSFDAADVTTHTPQHTCNGLAATIVGTTGPDRIVGTATRDVIVALGGNDTIDGLGGNDVICAGYGDDTVRAGWGNDLVLGGPGQDAIHGAHGNDRINGGEGRDRIEGGAGDDRLVGGNHIDTLLGNMGSDACWGRAVNQTLTTQDSRTTCERGRS